MNKDELEVPRDGVKGNRKVTVDMREIIGSHNILFLCLDTLRYDVAKEAEEKNLIPNINKYGKWEKRHAPGNFTYPSHHAMFSGFFPSPAEPTAIFDREHLFFPKKIGVSNIVPETSFAFEGSTIMEGLGKIGYTSYCIGGVAFFDKRSDIGRVLPSLFEKSYWRPSFGCNIKESFENQIEQIKKLMDKEEKKVFMYVNIDSIHYPNYFYLNENYKTDNLESHMEALKYVDSKIENILNIFREKGDTLVILCSDHGTCYGEEGYHFHCLSHEIVYTVPYKHFVLKGNR